MGELAPDDVPGPGLYELIDGMHIGHLEPSQVI